MKTTLAIEARPDGWILLAHEENGARAEDAWRQIGRRVLRAAFLQRRAILAVVQPWDEVHLANRPDGRLWHAQLQYPRMDRTWLGRERRVIEMIPVAATRDKCTEELLSEVAEATEFIQGGMFILSDASLAETANNVEVLLPVSNLGGVVWPSSMPKPSSTAVFLFQDDAALAWYAPTEDLESRVEICRQIALLAGWSSRVGQIEWRMLSRHSR